MWILIKTTSGGTLNISVNLSTTIIEVKKIIHDKGSVHPSFQILTFNGKTLDNNSTLDDHGVQDYSTLFLLFGSNQ